MFPIFMNFVLCFSILSYTYALAPPSSIENVPESTTVFDFEQKQKAFAQEKTFATMLSLLGARSRVKTLVDDLYPGRRPFHVGVVRAYEEILTSSYPKFINRSCIKVFRQRVLSYGISTQDFVDAIQSIYSSVSDNAAHKMSVFDPLPPKYNDVKGIEEMFENFGITPDEGKIKTAQIILEPLPSLFTTTTGF